MSGQDGAYQHCEQCLIVVETDEEQARWLQNFLTWKGFLEP